MKNQVEKPKYAFNENDDDLEPDEADRQIKAKVESEKEKKDAEKKSFYEAIWERDHPEEVQKAKEEAERKKMAEKAKVLQEKA